MPTFTFKSPEGQSYDIDGPEGATPEQAFGVLQQHLASQPKTPPAEPSNVVTRGLLGPLEAGGAAVANIPGRAINAVSDLVQRIGGNDSPKPLVGTIDTPQIGKEYLNDLANVPGVKQAGALAQKGDEAISSLGPTARDLDQGAGHVANDVLNVLPAAGLAGKVAGAASGVADAPAAAQYGFRTAADSPIARNVAGPSGREALTAHNQPLANTVLGAEAGVPHGIDVSYQSLEHGRAAPNAVYGRVAAALPEGPLSPTARATVSQAGGVGERITDGSPDAIDAINALKTQLLDPSRSFSGNQVVNEMRGLRQEGYVNVGSDDVSKQQLGRAQLDMAKGLEQHVADTLPTDADVSLGQLQGARTALAKNHAIQGALRGSDVDMQAIARMQRADPGVLTGPLADVADFANQHPEVSSLPGAGSRYNPPGVARDLSSIDVTNPRTWIQAAGGALARRSLTGSAADALNAARRAPVAGSAGEFKALPAPPPDTGGLSLVDELGGGAPAAGHPGDISLADLLSHGVEQGPSEGLSFGPTGAPKAEGLPFKVNADHAAGDLSLSQEPTLGDLMDDLRDMPEVMHQNKNLGVGTDVRGGQGRVMATDPAVPDGTMTRIQNNASGESSASLEAINRTRREQAAGQDRFLIDPDGKMWPVRGVDAADATAPKGSIIVQKGIGEEPYSILDRGGLPRANAHGLLNRALAGGHGMTLMDLLDGQ